MCVFFTYFTSYLLFSSLLYFRACIFKKCTLFFTVFFLFVSVAFTLEAQICHCFLVELFLAKLIITVLFWIMCLCLRQATTRTFVWTATFAFCHPFCCFYCQAQLDVLKSPRDNKRDLHFVQSFKSH